MTSLWLVSGLVATLVATTLDAQQLPPIPTYPSTLVVANISCSNATGPSCAAPTSPPHGVPGPHCTPCSALGNCMASDPGVVPGPTCATSCEELSALSSDPWTCVNAPLGCAWCAAVQLCMSTSTTTTTTAAPSNNASQCPLTCASIGHSTACAKAQSCRYCTDIGACIGRDTDCPATTPADISAVAVACSTVKSREMCEASAVCQYCPQLGYCGYRDESCLTRCDDFFSLMVQGTSVSTPEAAQAVATVADVNITLCGRALQCRYCGLKMTSSPCIAVTDNCTAANSTACMVSYGNDASSCSRDFSCAFCATLGLCTDRTSAACPTRCELVTDVKACNASSVCAYCPSLGACVSMAVFGSTCPGSCSAFLDGVWTADGSGSYPTWVSPQTTAAAMCRWASNCTYCNTNNVNVSNASSIAAACVPLAAECIPYRVNRTAATFPSCSSISDAAECTSVAYCSYCAALGYCKDAGAAMPCQETCTSFAMSATQCQSSTQCQYCSSVGLCVFANQTCPSMCHQVVSLPQLAGLPVELACSYGLDCTWCSSLGFCYQASAKQRNSTAPMCPLTCESIVMVDNTCQGAGSCRPCTALQYCVNTSQFCAAECPEMSSSMCQVSAKCMLCSFAGNDYCTVVAGQCSSSCAGLPTQAVCSRASSSCQWCAGLGGYCMEANFGACESTCGGLGSYGPEACSAPKCTNCPAIGCFPTSSYADVTTCPQSCQGLDLEYCNSTMTYNACRLCASGSIRSCTGLKQLCPDRCIGFKSPSACNATNGACQYCDAFQLCVSNARCPTLCQQLNTAQCNATPTYCTFCSQLGYCLEGSNISSIPPTPPSTPGLFMSRREFLPEAASIGLEHTTEHRHDETTRREENRTTERRDTTSTTTATTTTTTTHAPIGSCATDCYSLSSAATNAEEAEACTGGFVASCEFCTEIGLCGPKNNCPTSCSELHSIDDCALSSKCRWSGRFCSSSVCFNFLLEGYNAQPYVLFLVGVFKDIAVLVIVGWLGEPIICAIKRRLACRIWCGGCCRCCVCCHDDDDEDDYLDRANEESESVSSSVANLSQALEERAPTAAATTPSGASAGRSSAVAPAAAAAAAAAQSPRASTGTATSPPATAATATAQSPAGSPRASTMAAQPAAAASNDANLSPRGSNANDNNSGNYKVTISTGPAPKKEDETEETSSCILRAPLLYCGTGPVRHGKKYGSSGPPRDLIHSVTADSGDFLPGGFLRYAVQLTEFVIAWSLDRQRDPTAKVNSANEARERRSGTRCVRLVVIYLLLEKDFWIDLEKTKRKLARKPPPANAVDAMKSLRTFPALLAAPPQRLCEDIFAFLREIVPASCRTKVVYGTTPQALSRINYGLSAYPGKMQLLYYIVGASILMITTIAHVSAVDKLTSDSRFFLVGFRLINASTASTICLLFVKYMGVMWARFSNAVLRPIKNKMPWRYYEPPRRWFQLVPMGLEESDAISCHKHVLFYHQYVHAMSWIYFVMLIPFTITALYGFIIYFYIFIVVAILGAIFGFSLQLLRRWIKRRLEEKYVMPVAMPTDDGGVAEEDDAAAPLSPTTADANPAPADPVIAPSAAAAAAARLETPKAAYDPTKGGGRPKPGGKRARRASAARVPLYYTRSVYDEEEAAQQELAKAGLSSDGKTSRLLGEVSDRDAEGLYDIQQGGVGSDDDDDEGEEAAVDVTGLVRENKKFVGGVQGFMAWINGQLAPSPKATPNNSNTPLAREAIPFNQQADAASPAAGGKGGRKSVPAGSGSWWTRSRSARALVFLVGILRFLRDQTVPTLAVVIGLQASFNYTILSKYSQTYGVDYSQVTHLEYTSRSTACFYYTVQRDMLGVAHDASHALQMWSSFIPYM